MGAGGVGHIVEGVGLLGKARIGGHGAKRLLRGHLVDGLVCELMLKAAVLRHAVLQEVPQHAQGLPSTVLVKRASVLASKFRAERAMTTCAQLSEES